MGGVASDKMLGLMEASKSRMLGSISDPNLAQAIMSQIPVYNHMAVVSSLHQIHNRAESVRQGDNIQYLSTIEQIQNANNVMMRYIMADPYIRDLYDQGLCYGYGDQYVPEACSVYDTTEYRRVMNGLQVESEDGSGMEMTTWIYHDPSDVLTASQADDILATQRNARYHLRKQLMDPTNPFG